MVAMVISGKLGNFSLVNLLQTLSTVYLCNFLVSKYFSGCYGNNRKVRGFYLVNSVYCDTVANTIDSR